MFSSLEPRAICTRVSRGERWRFSRHSPYAEILGQGWSTADNIKIICKIYVHLRINFLLVEKNYGNLSLPASLCLLYEMTIYLLLHLASTGRGWRHGTLVVLCAVAASRYYRYALSARIFIPGPSALYEGVHPK
jgi:hypothetical protein